MANQYGRAYVLEFGIPHVITENSFVGPIAPFIQTGTETTTELVGSPAGPGLPQAIPTQLVTTTRDIYDVNPVRAQERAEEMDRFFASDNFSFRRITNHHIEFNIDKNKEAGGEDSSNDLKITIYNAADSTVGYLEEVSGKKPYISLKAGYEGNMKPIFKGNVERVEDNKIGTDRKTTIYCSDGGPAVKEALTFRSYPKGTAIDGIFEDLVQDLGLPVGSIATVRSPVVTNKPLYFSGSTARNLVRFTKKYGFQFSIQDMTANIVRELEPEYHLAAIVTPDTGLIGSVSFLDETKSSTTVGSNTPSEPEENNEEDKNLLDSLIDSEFITALRNDPRFIDFADTVFGNIDEAIKTVEEGLTKGNANLSFVSGFAASIIRDILDEQVAARQQRNAKKEKGITPRRGIKFKTLLNGAIAPNKLVAVEVPDREGIRRKSFYKAIKVVHNGSFEGESWYTEVEAEWVDPSTVRIRR